MSRDAEPQAARERSYQLWSDLHGGLDPRSSAWIAGWVRLTHACARPLARRGVAPDTVTVLGVLVSATVPVLAALGAGWPLLATLVMVGAAVVDGVDGALAAQTGTATRWGQVLDPLADRCSDLLLLLALVVLGAPAWLGVLLGALTLLLESVRSTAQAAGLHGPGAVTLWERPSRVIVAAFGSGIGGLVWLGHHAGLPLGGVDAGVVATVATGIGVVLAGTGLVHLVVVVRRSLR
jgi:phosphatidylglycerophosphate synthase